MISAWVYIALCAICTVWVADILKSAEKREGDILIILCVNYAVCSLASVILAERPVILASDVLSPGLILLSIMTGAVFLFNYLLYSKSVVVNGVGVSICAMRLSLVLPVLLSATLFHEVPYVLQWIGIILAVAVFPLLIPAFHLKDEAKVGAAGAGLLLGLFILTGSGDSLLKIFEEVFSSQTGIYSFLYVSFGTSFLLSAILILAKNRRAKSNSMWIGVYLSVPNLLAVYFLLKALSLGTGGVIYASVSILSVLGGGLLGVIRWGDRLNPRQWAGLVLAVIAVIFLVWEPVQ